MPFLITFAALLALILLGAFYAYRVAFHSPQRGRGQPPPLPRIEKLTKDGDDPNLVICRAMEEMAALPFERVYIKSHDGLRLAADYYHVRDGAPLQIQLHGYRGSGLRDFCGGNRLARQMGHNTLVIHQRSHGESEGHAIAFGLNERRDCQGWAEYAAHRFGGDVPIFLTGVSMGAATAIMAAGLPLPENVVGVIADSPYSSPREIILKVAGDMKLPPRLALPFVWLGAKIFGGFTLSREGCIQAAAETKLPILLIHGAEDDFVPPEMSARIAAAAPNARREEFPDASHGVSYIMDPMRYKAVTEEFVRQCLESFGKQIAEQ